MNKDKNKIKYDYCPYCNGVGYINFEHPSTKEIFELLDQGFKVKDLTEKQMEKIEKEHKCFACKGTGKRVEDYGGLNQR